MHPARNPVTLLDKCERNCGIETLFFLILTFKTWGFSFVCAGDVCSGENLAFDYCYGSLRNCVAVLHTLAAVLCIMLFVALAPPPPTRVLFRLAASFASLPALAQSSPNNNDATSLLRLQTSQTSLGSVGAINSFLSLLSYLWTLPRNVTALRACVANLVVKTGSEALSASRAKFAIFAATVTAHSKVSCMPMYLES